MIIIPELITLKNRLKSRPPLHNYGNSSSLVTVPICLLYYDTSNTTQVGTRSNKQQQPDHAHTIKRWQISNNPNYRISYRAQRMRLLLANIVKNEIHNLCWLREYDQQAAKPNTISWRCLMSYVPCRWGCGTYVMFSDTVLSKNGKKIPIQENGLNHDCHLSPYYRSKSNNARAVAAAKKPL
jgi:hypothetical protein